MSGCLTLFYCRFATFVAGALLSRRNVQYLVIVYLIQLLKCVQCSEQHVEIGVRGFGPNQWSNLVILISDMKRMYCKYVCFVGTHLYGFLLI